MVMIFIITMIMIITAIIKIIMVILAIITMIMIIMITSSSFLFPSSSLSSGAVTDMQGVLSLAP